MDEKNLNEFKPRCGNCRYFYAHYTFSHGRFIKTCFGHCTNDRYMRKKSNKSLLNFDTCEMWEINKTVNEERYNQIEDALKSIAENIDDIAQLLKTDL